MFNVDCMKYTKGKCTLSNHITEGFSKIIFGSKCRISR